MLTNNNQRIQRGSTPGQQQQRRIQIAQKNSDEPPSTNPRNIRITTQTQQKYIPSANRMANNTAQRQNLGGVGKANQNQYRNGESRNLNQDYNPSILQSTNRGIDRQQTIIKQNNEIAQINNIIPNIQNNQPSLNKPPVQLQGRQRNDQKPQFMIRKTNTNVVPNKSTVVSNSNQNTNQANQPRNSNPTVPSMTTSTRIQQNNQINNTQNMFQSSPNPARKYIEPGNAYGNSSSSSNNGVANNQNQNSNLNTTASIQSVNENNLQNNQSLRESQIPSSTNLNNIRNSEMNNAASRRTIIQNTPPTNTNNIATLLSQSNHQNNEQISNNNSNLRQSLLDNRISISSNQQASNNQNDNQNSYTRSTNTTTTSSQAQPNSTLLRPSILSTNNTTASQLNSLRGNQEERLSDSNTNSIQNRSSRPLINAGSSTTQPQNSNATSQRLTGPNSSWLRDTQNALQNINSILSQTNNALNRAENIAGNSSNTNNQTSQMARNSRINPLSPTNADINREESAVEEMQRDLELLSQQRRQQEQQTLARQAFEDRMARANHQVRQLIRDDYRRSNGRNMSGSSSDSDIESEEEEQKVNINSGTNPTTRYDRNRMVSNSSSDSDDSEEERKDARDREREGQRGRTYASSSVPPIRNSNSNPLHFLNFRHRVNNDTTEESNNNAQQTMAQRLGISFNMVYNGRQADTSARSPGSLVQRLVDQASNSDSNNRGNNLSQQNQSGETRTFRIYLPVNPSNGNQRNLLEGLRNLVSEMNSSLGNFNGSFNNARLEDLAQWVATIRLLQQFTQQRKLSEEQLREFPVIKIKEIEENEMCSICLDEWQINDQAKLLGCMHKFHPKCIDDWLKEKTICPNCKQDQLQFFSDKIPENLQQQSQ